MSSRDSDSADSADDLSSEDEGVKIRAPAAAKPAAAADKNKKSSDDDDDLDTVATPTSDSEPKAKPTAPPVKPPAQQPTASPSPPPAAAPSPPATAPVATTPPPLRASPVTSVPAKPPQSPQKEPTTAKKPASPSPPKPKPKPPSKPKPKDVPKQALHKSGSTNQVQVGRYASSTESMKARVQAIQKDKKDHPSPEKRKAKGKPKTDAKFVLGKRVDEICQHASAAFASSTPRDLFAEVMHPDIPGPGIYSKDRPVPVISAFPNTKDKSRDHPTGFGSTCPRDSIYTLTNGSTTYRKFEKEFFATVEAPKSAARRQSAPPIQTSVCGTPLVRAAPKEKPPLDKQKTYERMALYSSFDMSACDKSAAWAKSKTPRLAIDTVLPSEQKPSGKDKKSPPSPKPEVPAKFSEVLEKARKEVEKRAAKRDPAGPAFGTKSPRECLTIMATCTPPPGQYEIP